MAATCSAAAAVCSCSPAPAGLPAFSGLASQATLRRAASSRACSAVALPRVAGKARVRCAAGDVSAEGTQYLIAGAVAIALVGSAFPLLFSRKDLCTVCDGSGFVRSQARLGGNSGRKDDQRIVCPNCKGLGKINQVDK